MRNKRLIERYLSRLQPICMLTGVLVSGSCVAAEGVLQNKRLFFTDTERSVFTDTPVTVEANTEIHTKHETVLKRDTAPNVVNRKTVRHQSGGVKFNAVVHSATHFSVVINGASCKAAVRHPADHQKSERLLNCPHLLKKGAEVVWLPAHEQLVVRKNGHEVGRLDVGDSL